MGGNMIRGVESLSKGRTRFAGGCLITDPSPRCVSVSLYSCYPSCPELRRGETGSVSRVVSIQGIWGASVSDSDRLSGVVGVTPTLLVLSRRGFEDSRIGDEV